MPARTGRPPRIGPACGGPFSFIGYLQADDKYVTIVTGEGEALIREPLKDLLPRLDPRRFAQIHRSTIVNLDWVDAAIRDDSGKLRLRMRGIDRALPVSRLYAPLFKPM